MLDNAAVSPESAQAEGHSKQATITYGLFAQIKSMAAAAADAAVDNVLVLLFYIVHPMFNDQLGVHARHIPNMHKYNQ